MYRFKRLQMKGRRMDGFSEAGAEKWAELSGAERWEDIYQGIAEFDSGFADYIRDSSFGMIWSRPGLPTEIRSLITIAGLVASGRLSMLKAHLGIAHRLGIPEAQIKEVIIHMAPYWGIPVVMDAMRIFQEVLAEREA
jgi:4-carboxymuconolactone decarboxylase